jgi:hypothetical protein
VLIEGKNFASVAERGNNLLRDKERLYRPTTTGKFSRNVIQNYFEAQSKRRPRLEPYGSVEAVGCKQLWYYNRVVSGKVSGIGFLVREMLLSFTYTNEFLLQYQRYVGNRIKDL